MYMLENGIQTHKKLQSTLNYRTVTVKMSLPRSMISSKLFIEVFYLYTISPLIFVENLVSDYFTT